MALKLEVIADTDSQAREREREREILLGMGLALETLKLCGPLMGESLLFCVNFIG